MDIWLSKLDILIAFIPFRFQAKKGQKKYMLTNIALKLNLSACTLAPTGLPIPAFPKYRRT